MVHRTMSPVTRGFGRLWVALLLGILPAGCASAPLQPVTSAEAARIRTACPEGTFIGAMTITCPQVVR